MVKVRGSTSLKLVMLAVTWDVSLFHFGLLLVALCTAFFVTWYVAWCATCLID